MRTVQLIKDLAREIRLVEVRNTGAGEAFGKGSRIKWQGQASAVGIRA